MSIRKYLRYGKKVLPRSNLPEKKISDADSVFYTSS